MADEVDEVPRLLVAAPVARIAPARQAGGADTVGYDVEQLAVAEARRAVAHVGRLRIEPAANLRVALSIHAVTRRAVIRPMLAPLGQHGGVELDRILCRPRRARHRGAAQDAG